ncbi:MAG: hypothetical protein ACFCUR_17785 [Rhodomicrobiaceae bacterium]
MRHRVFRGIEINICTWSGIKWPDPASLLKRQPDEQIPLFHAQIPVKPLRACSSSPTSWKQRPRPAHAYPPTYGTRKLDDALDRFNAFEKADWNYFRQPPDDFDKPSTLTEQLDWLRGAGFADVDVHWMMAGHPSSAAGAGKRTQPQHLCLKPL